MDIWVDGTDFTPPVINNVIGGQDLTYGICVSGYNNYNTVVNFSFDSMPLNEIDVTGGQYVINPLSPTSPIVTFDGPTTQDQSNPRTKRTRRLLPSHRP